MIEYDPRSQGVSHAGNRHTRSDVYRLNGIAAVLLDPSDLATPDWQQRLYDRLEQSYRQPLAYLRDRSPWRQG